MAENGSGSLKPEMESSDENRLMLSVSGGDKARLCCEVEGANSAGEYGDWGTVPLPIYFGVSPWLESPISSISVVHVST